MHKINTITQVNLLFYIKMHLCVCVHEQLSLKCNKKNTESAVEASISSERSKDDKWRWEQNRGQAKSKTQEEGDRKRNLYLLTSSSDSSVSDQLSKSGHRVRRSLERSAMCIFVFITRRMENTRSQSRGRAINSVAKGNGWKNKNKWRRQTGVHVKFQLMETWC